MAIEIVDFPIKNGGSFHCYISSPEGKSWNVDVMYLMRELDVVLPCWVKFIGPFWSQRSAQCGDLQLQVGL